MNDYNLFLPNLNKYCLVLTRQAEELVCLGSD